MLMTFPVYHVADSGQTIARQGAWQVAVIQRYATGYGLPTCATRCYATQLGSDCVLLLCHGMHVTHCCFFYVHMHFQKRSRETLRLKTTTKTTTTYSSHAWCLVLGASYRERPYALSRGGCVRDIVC